MKQKVIDEMAESHGYTKVAAGAAFDSVFASVKTVVERDGRVLVPGFGTFNRKFRAGGREVKNPRTGEMVRTSDRTVTTFKETRPGR